MGVAYQNIVSAWARTKPADAYAWLRTKGGGEQTGMDISTFRWLPKRIFAQWTANDPFDAVMELQSAPLEDQNAATYGIVDGWKQSPNPRLVLSAIASMPDGPMKTEVMQEVAEAWAEEAPE